MSKNNNSDKKLIIYNASEARFRNAIEKNRFIFLQYLKETYNIPSIKASLWRGTALHLLELTHSISPEMHEAAETYFSLSHHLKKGGPRLSQSPTTRVHSRSTAPLRDRFYDEEKEKKTEKRWRNVLELLEKKKIRSILDELGEPQDLGTLEYLLRTKSALLRIQEGLSELHNYLKEEDC